MALQRVFQAASAATRRQGAGVSITQARAVQLGNGNSIDLVSLLVDIGAGPQGRGTAAAGRKRTVEKNDVIAAREPLIDGFDDRQWWHM